MKKGQAALEFLMTYGWAFLVILVMIGTLAYFGVLNVSALLPDRCQFSTQPVSCKNDQFTIRKAGDPASGDMRATIIAKLTNSNGASAYLYDAEVMTDYEGICTPGNYYVCIENATPQDGICNATDAVINGTGKYLFHDLESRNLLVVCDNGDALAVGNKVKFNIRFRWHPATTSELFYKKGVGEIYSTVVEP